MSYLTWRQLPYKQSFRDEFTNGFEYNTKLAIVLLLQLIEAPGKPLVRDEHLTEMPFSFMKINRCDCQMVVFGRLERDVRVNVEAREKRDERDWRE